MKNNPADLDKAAKEYADYKDFTATIKQEAFKAGALWQSKQNKENWTHRFETEEQFNEFIKWQYGKGFIDGIKEVKSDTAECLEWIRTQAVSGNNGTWYYVDNQDGFLEVVTSEQLYQLFIKHKGNIIKSGANSVVNTDSITNKNENHDTEGKKSRFDN